MNYISLTNIVVKGYRVEINYEVKGEIKIKSLLERRQWG